ncbi:hypothetical protein LMG19282_05147 [Cupriavidus campinensis]|nr:hypothetical protein LMG19282_05147 [Cupriavidus campinensis]
MGGGRHHARTAGQQVVEHGGILAAEHAQGILPDQRAQPGAVAFLDRHDLRMVGQPQRQRGRDCGAGALRHVVEHQRARRLAGHAAHVPGDALVRHAQVVRRRNQVAGQVETIERAHLLADRARIHAAHACHHRHAALRHLEHGRGDHQPFRFGQQAALARGAEHDQAVHAGAGIVRGQLLGGAQVGRAVAQRRDQRQPQAIANDRVSVRHDRSPASS